MDPVWLLMALVFGFVAQQLRLPPLVGFLIAGFALNFVGVEGGVVLEEAATLGVTLLLFTIGLKLRVQSLLSPPIWGGATTHMLLSVMLGIGLLGLLGVAGLSYLGDMDFRAAATIAFALSFSSTVFAVKILEGRSEMRARHGVIAIGILIFQDLVAVIFLLLSEDGLPSAWAAALLALPFVRPLLVALMVRAGHGEVLALFGLGVAILGGELFSFVGMKAGLGALVFGILLANHAKSEELSRAMLQFKDFFLIGFFLSIGLIGLPTLADVALTIVLLATLLPLKMLLFFLILTRFRLRARTAFLCALELATFSEFGLIVASGAADVGWIGSQWLVISALILAGSFALSSLLNARAHELYTALEEGLCRFQTEERLPEDEPPDPGDAEILVVGMGRVGRGAYETLRQHCDQNVLGVDVDRSRVAMREEEGYSVIVGDAEDVEFWRHIVGNRVALVMLALPTHEDVMLAVRLLKNVGYTGRIGAIAKYEEELADLEAAGVHSAFNYYSEVGAGFADHVLNNETTGGNSGTVDSIATATPPSG